MACKVLLRLAFVFFSLERRLSLPIDALDGCVWAGSGVDSLGLASGSSNGAPANGSG